MSMPKLALAIASVAIVALLVTVLVLKKRTDASVRKAAKFDEFCMATRDAARQDRTAFDSGDSRRQEEAYDRFYEGLVMFHNSQSFLMCVDEIPSLPIGCRLNKDWNCLARIAGEIEQKIPRYGSL